MGDDSIDMVILDIDMGYLDTLGDAPRGAFIMDTSTPHPSLPPKL